MWSLRGILGAKPPPWANILAAADGDPLRAQEIENGVSELWWERWLALMQARSEVKP